MAIIVVLACLLTAKIGPPDLCSVILQQTSTLEDHKDQDKADTSRQHTHTYSLFLACAYRTEEIFMYKKD
jgi:hypothetical protein